jgi:hypothetical protein
MTPRAHLERDIGISEDLELSPHFRHSDWLAGG